MKSKYIGLIIFIIIIIAICAFYIYEYNSNTNCGMSYYEIESLLDKSNNYSNYRIKRVYTNANNQTDENDLPWLYFKDGKTKMESKSTAPNGFDSLTIIWQDTNTGKFINIQKQPVGGTESKKTFRIYRMTYNQVKLFAGQSFSMGLDYDYKVLPDEVYDNQDCVVVESIQHSKGTSSDGQTVNNSFYNKYYISKETGFIICNETKAYSNGKLQNEYTSKSIIEFDVVKDEDVVEPKQEDFPDYVIENSFY